MRQIFSPERLTLARQRRGLKKQELAARVDVSPKTVSRWERGERAPDDVNLRALSEALDFSVEYFFGDAPPLLEDWAFRSLDRMTASERDMALAAGAQAVGLDLWLEEVGVERPALEIPDLRGHSPDEAALSVRAAWGLGLRPAPNMVHLLEYNGVRVYSLVHDGTEVDAFSVWYGQIPFVFLNTRVTGERSRHDAAHELGHLVLHARTGGGGTREENAEANAFAANFLMPKDQFIATAPRRVSLVSIALAKQRWGVSALSYVRRMHVLGLVSDWQYKSMCIEIKTQYPKTEPDPARPNEASQVLAWAFSPASGLSRRDAAAALKIPISDLDEMTFGLALTPIRGDGTPQPEPAESEPRPTLRVVK